MVMLRIMTKTSTRYFGHCDFSNQPISRARAHPLGAEARPVNSFSFSTMQSKKLFVVERIVCFEQAPSSKFFFGFSSSSQNKCSLKTDMSNIIKTETVLFTFLKEVLMKNRSL